MIDEKEIVRRRDMRDVFTFTIDPADAKDFDDAISFECLSENDSERSFSESGLSAKAVYQIGIHIADVSFYVRPGTKIDDEAYQRGTSVYLVDRVIPMLPEELCNDKCSLKPGEDKLCMSVIFTFEVPRKPSGELDFEAFKITKHKICRTVIRSDVRLDYNQAQQLIESVQTRQRHDNDTTTTRQRHDNEPQEQATLTLSISVLNAMATKLRAERIAKGALTIEQDEIRFRLDEHHHPIEIYFEQPNESHHLIEEFMLLANRTVATSVGSGRPFVYRVHDLPDYDKLEEIKKLKRQYKLVKRSDNKAMQRAIDMLTIRAQAKAVYSTYNIGHYGLAFTHYTHFTSPIRRYPDLMVHRLVEKYILTGKKETMPREEMEMMCEHCSACEQEAAQAERESIKMYQAMWMADHVGEVLSGHITGITEFGFFVQLDDSHCEGLVHMMTIEHPENFVLGDSVTVQVVKVEVNRSQIDFELV